VLQLAQRLGLDLADALAGDGELLGDLHQGVVGGRAPAEAHAQDAFLGALFSGDPSELTRCCHFAAQPFRRDVEAVGPRRGAELEKHAGEVTLIAQWLEHGAWLVDHGGEVVLASTAVAEADAEAKAAEFF
jgi:hypothetical protein